VGLVVLVSALRVAAAITYTYDPLQRLTGVTYSSGSTIAYTYDAAGNRLTVASKAALSPVVANGGGTVGGAGLYALGAKVSLTAKPAAGYTFLRWEDGSQTPSRSLLYTDASLIVTAYFEQTNRIPSPTLGDPGAPRALLGVLFTLPLTVTSPSLPTVTVAGLPAGLKYDAATKSITGVPTAAIADQLVTITAKNVNPTPTTRTFHLAVEPLPVWAQGNFSGWFEGAPGPGPISLAVTTQGKISGKFSAAGANYTFGAPSYARREGDGSFWVSCVASAGKAVLPLTLAVRSPVGAVPPTLSAVDGWFAATAAGAPAATLYRNVWKDAGMATIAADFAGYFTATLPGAAAYGSGYLAFTVDAAGGIKTAGKLADGTPVSLSGTLILDEASRVFTVLYTSPPTYQGGCLFGLAEFVTPPANAPVLVSLLDDVPCVWESRNPQATPDYRAGGFDRDLGLSGGWYDTVGNLNRYYLGRTLAVGTNAGAVAPEILVGVTRYPSVCWDPQGIVLTPVLKAGVMTGLVAPAAGLPLKLGNAYDYHATNTVGLTVSLTRATGLFKGSFKAWFDYATTHTSKSLAFEGVLTPESESKGASVEGRGFFLWPDKAQYLNPPAKPLLYPFNRSYDFLLLATP
jgi:YD repeat-containing protein